MNFQTQPGGMWMKIHIVRYEPLDVDDLSYGSLPIYQKRD